MVDRQQWEYRMIEPSKGLTKREAINSEDKLNELGADGWRLIETVSYDQGGTKLFVLERRVDPDLDSDHDEGSS